MVKPMRMLKTMITLALLPIWLSACGQKGGVESWQSLDYMQSQLGEPLEYPEHLDKPYIDPGASVPDLPEHLQNVDYDLNTLIQPPSLLQPLARQPLESQ